MRVLFYTTAVIAANLAAAVQLEAYQATTPAAESPSERQKRQNQELISKTVAEASKPKPVAAEAKGSAEAKPSGPKAEGQKPSEGGAANTGKDPLVSAIITKAEQLDAGLQAIDKQVCDNAKRAAQNKANAEIIDKMNKQITAQAAKKKKEVQDEAEEIRAKGQKQDE